MPGPSQLRRRPIATRTKHHGSRDPLCLDGPRVHPRGPFVVSMLRKHDGPVGRISGFFGCNAARTGRQEGEAGRAPHGATVIVFYSTECPISNSYSPTLATLVDAFGPRSVNWVGVCVDPDLSDSEVQTHARDFGFKFPVVRDKHGSFARKIGAKMTPEAFVLDAEGKIRYHGRIDDQFVARQKRNANPSESELKDALAAVLNGKEVKNPHVEAIGCPLPEHPDAASGPTYCKDVAPILQKNCQECHRPGQVGPFASRPTNRRGSARPTSPRWSRIVPCRPGRPPLISESSSRTFGLSATRRSRPWSPGRMGMLLRAIRLICRRPPSFPMTGSSARPTSSSTSAPISPCRRAATTSIAVSSSRPI